MLIKIGDTTLCEGIERNQTGRPIGPANLSTTEQPGVEKRDYVGADRTANEHVRCNHGTVTFDVERIFPTVEAALDYALGDIYSEDVEGALVCDSRTVFEHAAVTARAVRHVGCAVAVSYTIEG